MFRLFIVNNPIVSWINDSLILAMGLNKLYVYFVLIFIGVLISYFLIEPMIIWFIALQSTKLLSYIVTSLIVIVLFFIIVLFTNEMNGSTFSLLKVVLQCLASLGILLIVIQSVQFIIKRT